MSGSIFDLFDAPAPVKEPEPVKLWNVDYVSSARFREDNIFISPEEIEEKSKLNLRSTSPQQMTRGRDGSIELPTVVAKATQNNLDGFFSPRFAEPAPKTVLPWSPPTSIPSSHMREDPWKLHLQMFPPMRPIVQTPLVKSTESIVSTFLEVPKSMQVIGFTNVAKAIDTRSVVEVLVKADTVYIPYLFSQCSFAGIPLINVPRSDPHYLDFTVLCEVGAVRNPSTISVR